MSAQDRLPASVTVADAARKAQQRDLAQPNGTRSISPIDLRARLVKESLERRSAARQQPPTVDRHREPDDPAGDGHPPLRQEPPQGDQRPIRGHQGIHPLDQATHQPAGGHPPARPGKIHGRQRRQYPPDGATGTVQRNRRCGIPTCRRHLHPLDIGILHPVRPPGGKRTARRDDLLGQGPGLRRTEADDRVGNRKRPVRAGLRTDPEGTWAAARQDHAELLQLRRHPPGRLGRGLQVAFQTGHFGTATRVQRL
jgi:hypothetical protein